MEKARKFQIVYGGPTNLCQQSTANLARGIMRNERKQSTTREYIDLAYIYCVANTAFNEAARVQFLVFV